MFYQSIKQRKTVFYFFSPHYLYIIKQMKKSKQCITLWKNSKHLRILKKWRKHSLRLKMSTFPPCSQMPVVFYHSVIHSLSLVLHLLIKFLVLKSCIFQAKDVNFGKLLISRANPLKTPKYIHNSIDTQLKAWINFPCLLRLKNQKWKEDCYNCTFSRIFLVMDGIEWAKTIL